MRKKTVRPETTVLNFRFNKREAAFFRRLCGMKGVLMSDVMSDLLEKWLKKHRCELPAQIIAEVEAAVI